MSNSDIAGYPRKEVNGVINFGQVPGPLTDFVVCFRYNYGGVKDLPDQMLDASANSADATRKNIIAAVSSGTPSTGLWDRVPCHVEELVVSGTEAIRRAIIWVRIPSISSSTNTKVAFFWGGAGNSQQSGGTFGINAVWSGYPSVYTMQDLTTSTIEDFGVNGVDGTKTPGSGNPTEVDTILGKGQNFVNTSSEYIQMSGFLGSPSSFTWSFWVKPTTATGLHDMVSMGDNQHCRIDGAGNIDYFYRYSGAWQGLTYVADLRDNNWHHIVFLGQAGNQKLFVDGVLRDSATNANAPAYDIGTNTFFGKHGIASSNYFDGDMTKAILRNAVWSNDHTIATYNNQKENSTFITRGNSPEANILPTTMLPIQRIAAQMTSGQTSINVPITAVSSTRLTLILFTWRVDTDQQTQYTIRASLNGTTSVDFNRTASGSVVDIELQVIEWTSDSAVRILRAANSMTGLTLVLGTPLPYPTSKTFIITSFNGGGGGWGANEMVKWSVASDGLTTTFERSASAFTLGTNIQVVTHHNCNVQQISYSSAAASFNTAITAINQNKAFVYASSMSSSVVGFEQVGRVFFASDTSVTIEKYTGSATIEGFIYVVEFTDSTIIGKLNDALTSGESNVNKTIQKLFFNRAAVFWGSTTYGFQSSNTTNDDMESSGISMRLTDSKTLNLKRTNPGHAARFQIWVMSQGAAVPLVNGGLVNNCLARGKRLIS